MFLILCEFICVLQWCVSGWMFISLWLPASCMERINLLVWGAENLPNIMVFIQVPRWCYFGNHISRVFYMYNVFTLLLVFNSLSFSTIAWQIESTTKTKCTGSSSRKQRITSLADYFGPKTFKMQLFTSSSPGNALWHRAFLQNMNSHWHLIELAVN